MMLDKNELRYQLALYYAPTIGPIHYRRLLHYFNTAETVFFADTRTLKGLGITEAAIRYLMQPDWQRIDQALAWSDSPHHHIITLTDPNYPYRLKEIHDPPPLLFIIGNPTLLNLPQLAMVGSRNPSPIGKEIAEQLAMQLAQAGLCVTSGLALGIDAASHQGALKANGPTIAVLGNGLHSIYPARHQALAEHIAETGALISEFPLEVTPHASHFPRRNRIISGLCLGTLVVEATIHSGSLITARLALEQGRDVFAVPGSIYHPLAYGCNTLIQQGAKLVHTVADILEELPLEFPSTTPPASAPQYTLNQKLDGARLKLVECIGFEVTSIDQLIARSGFSAQKATSELLILELHGYIKPVSGGYIRVKS